MNTRAIVASAFAAAIIHRPEILFLDEPFESIDPAGVALMKRWLRRFTAEGRTVFMTTHVLETVERVCDRAALRHRASVTGLRVRRRCRPRARRDAARS